MFPDFNFFHFSFVATRGENQTASLASLLVSSHLLHSASLALLPARRSEVSGAQRALGRRGLKLPVAPAALLCCVKHPQSQHRRFGLCGAGNFLTALIINVECNAAVLQAGLLVQPAPAFGGEKQNGNIPARVFYPGNFSQIQLNKHTA